MKYKYWHTTSFWGKLKDSIAFIGTGSQITLSIVDSTEFWQVFAGVATILGYMISLWFDDKNKDGIADVFETEVTTTITSATPIDVKIEEKPKE